MTKAFTPTLRDDGTLDPECLEQVGLRWVKQWLKDRLSGSDPYFPIDDRAGEDPDALVVGILRDAGLAHPASGLIERAVVCFLEQAQLSAPKLPPYFEHTLRLCQQIRLPLTSSWFAQELQEFAQAPVKAEKQWGGRDLAMEILFAAVLQTPGATDTVSRRHWQRLVDKPACATLALLGLGGRFADRARYLKNWWQACPAEERAIELPQIILRAVKMEGEDEIRSVLTSLAPSLLPALKEALNHALRENGVPDVFPEEGDALVSAIDRGEYPLSLRR